MENKVHPKYREYERIVESAIREYGPTIRSIQKTGYPGHRPYQTDGTREHAIYTAWGMLVGHIRGFRPLDGIEVYINRI